MYNCILLRYGEIGLKSRRTRARFEKLYLNAIKSAIKKVNVKNYTIKNLGKRYVIFSDDISLIIPILKKVPGIQSMSPALKVEFDSKEDLIKKVKEKTIHLVKDKIFCIKAKRSGEHNFKSMELQKEVGDELYNESKGVNLTNPEVKICLEIRHNDCFIYTKTITCLGGLPPKTAGKVLCLFSGGIDSPVATYQMLKRGTQTDFLFINLLGEIAFSEVAKVYNHLVDNYVFDFTPKFYIIDGRKIVEKIISEVPGQLRQIILKIIFYKLGEKLAEKENHLALVTGEALSQKSSQTLQSLKLINSQINFPVLRPLISFDKTEITKIADEIGSLEFSIKVKEYCSLSDGPVVTAPKESVLENMPDFTELINEEIKNVLVYKGKFELNKNITESFSNSKKYFVIDLRSNYSREKKEIVSNKHMKIQEIFNDLTGFEKDQNYLLLCDFGLKSKEAANHLRKKEINAIGLSLEEYLDKDK